MEGPGGVDATLTIVLDVRKDYPETSLVNMHVTMYLLKVADEVLATPITILGSWDAGGG
jgi:hypothetical protein